MLLVAQEKSAKKRKENQRGPIKNREGEYGYDSIKALPVIHGDSFDPLETSG